jgi:drug/metabolite transporter (DMT)-like permease
VVGFGLYNASMRHLPSSVANLIVTSEPVFTALLAFALFRERLGGPQLAGSALVLGGVVILRFRERWRAAPEEAEQISGSLIPPE